MTDKELDAIMNRLTSAGEHRKQIKLAKAKAEIETIQREAEAYWDGVCDALKEVKNALPEPPKEGERWTVNTATMNFA